MANEISATMVIVLMLILGTYQTASAEKNGDIRYNYSDSTTTIPLPFNSHIADQLYHNEKIEYSKNILPFP
jgi:hypothetical protein